ncbi:MAG: hypothetical protein L3J29_00245 [Cyclobacteriaceae bacterium]|nr:hypothetical protein [Cyclobacteriaceae bacterium]
MKWIWILLVAAFGSLQAQDLTSESEEEEVFKHNRLSIIISQTHVPKAFQSSTGDKGIIMPSWGFNYEYWFNRKFALGIHSDMEISTYIIEDENGQELERTRPFIVALVGIYNPWKGLELIGGFGREFEENKNFWMYRIGVEYEIEIGDNWDIAPGLVFDIKEDLYDSWTVGLGVGKRF